MTAKGVDRGHSIFVSVWPHSAALRTASLSKVRFANWRQNNWVKSALVLTYSGKPAILRPLIRTSSSGLSRYKSSRSNMLIEVYPLGSFRSARVSRISPDRPRSAAAR